MATTAEMATSSPGPEARVAQGRAERTRIRRIAHGEWAPAADRPDPLTILGDQEARRVPELVPIRRGRMAASNFAFYRGAAAVMAADLAAGPRTRLEVQLCGDAHLVNFGAFGSPERELLFDVNDFDETLAGPFEWDVKRLAASLEVAGRDRGFTAGQRTRAVAACVAEYRRTMAEFAGQGALAIWYARLNVDDIVRRWGAEAGQTLVANLRRTVAKAESKDHLKAVAKLTTRVGGQLQFVNDPPLVVRADELGPDVEFRTVVTRILRSYRRTLSGDRRRLLERYRFVDLARKVVGVGSVGTRCWVVLLVGRDDGDPLVLQVKEAEASVLEAHLSRSPFDSSGQRVVEGQRLMQAASDIFLGWDRGLGVDGVTRDYYTRQLWDWKGSADVATMVPRGLAIYAQVCAWTLARAHARSGDPVAISAYLGRGEQFDRALVDFARAYADQNARDRDALVAAIAAGLPAESGV